MSGGSGGGPRLRYTWGYAVLTGTGVAGILLAAVLAGGLSPDAELTAERIFWGAWLGGVIVAALTWVWYVRRPGGLAGGRRTRPRSRAAIVAAGPFLGVVGLALNQFAPDPLRFGFLGAGSGFLLAFMVGYALAVRRQRKGTDGLPTEPSG
jgi:hypothetical protein